MGILKHSSLKDFIKIIFNSYYSPCTVYHYEQLIAINTRHRCIIAKIKFLVFIEIYFCELNLLTPLNLPINAYQNSDDKPQISSACKRNQLKFGSVNMANGKCCLTRGLYWHFSAKQKFRK